jgi:hypothetical protein
MARVDEASMEFEAGHDRHMDQAGCFVEKRGREKFGRRRESVDRMASDLISLHKDPRRVAYMS